MRTPLRPVANAFDFLFGQFGFGHEFPRLGPSASNIYLPKCGDECIAIAATAEQAFDNHSGGGEK